MAMTERSRHKLFETFSGLVGDEQAVEEMLSHFLARDVEEPVTKDFLRAEIIGVRAETAELRADMHEEFRKVRAETAELREDMREEFAKVRAEMQQAMRTTQTWFVGTGISLAGLMLAIARFG